MIAAARAGALRSILVVVLLVSPLLFPILVVLLRLVDGEWARGGLGELYRWTWGRLVRGYL